MERYSEYKDSGVKWLGEIPSHWEVVPIKHSYKFTVGWTPPTGRNDLFEGINLWANISDLGDKVIRTTTNHISDSAVRQSGRSISPKGSLLYSFKLSVGTVSFCGADMYTNEAIATFLKGKNSLEFLYYAAPIFIIKNANTNIYGAPILNQDLIKNALVLLPPLSEQDAIVRYLDSATSEIDKAIAMQQKMIDLLNERKQIIIQNAVTKGLDENVEMKESGVESIGRIPIGWKIKKLKYVMRSFGRIGFRGYGTKDIVDEGQGAITLSPSNIQESSMDYSKRTYLSWNKYYESPEIMIENGDVLMVKTGSSYGKCAIVKNMPMECTINPQLVVFKEHTEMPEYLAYCFQTSFAKFFINTSVIGGTIPTISQEKINNYVFPFPMKSEQQQIVTYLDSEMQRFDSAITNCQRQITLLQERKQIIINEVVTGKVRVS